MEGFKISMHAERRMQLRGIRERDLALVLACGTRLNGDSVLVLEKDIDRAIGDRGQKEIARLQRLRGIKIVNREGVVVTCYWPTSNQALRVVCRGRNRNHLPGTRSGRNRDRNSSCHNIHFGIFGPYPSGLTIPIHRLTIL